MRRLFFIFIAIAFLLRGFMGDAMAVAMAHDAMSLPTTLTAAAASEKTSPAPSCHEMAQSSNTTQNNSGLMSHDHCQLCCAVIAVPSAALLTFDQAAFFSRPVGFTPSFASNDLLPAFKPPIL